MRLNVFVSLLVSQLCSVSTSTTVITKEHWENRKEDLPVERNKAITEPDKPEIPAFLITIYKEMMDRGDGHGEERLLKSFQAEWDQANGEFYFLSSLIQTPLQNVWKVEFFISFRELPPTNQLTVSIYETHSGVKVSSRHLSSRGSGWLGFPATKVMNQWITQQHASFRFKVFVTAKVGEQSEILENGRVPQFWLVVYTAKPDHYQIFPPLPWDNEKSPSSKDRIRRQEPEPTTVVKSRSSCGKTDMIVNSSDILIKQAKVVFPRSFNAYQCSGECSHTNKTKFINHSILRALMMQKNGTKVEGEPCCVPSKLKSIGLIHRTGKWGQGFEIRTVKNMIVEECMCY